MKNGSSCWRGFKFIKIIIVVLLVILLHSNMSDKQLHRTENLSFNKSLGMRAMATKSKEQKPEVYEVEVNNNKVEKENDSFNEYNRFSGELTGYSADCPACTGKLACKASYDVYKNGVVTYPDYEYGNVRIVASSKKLPCGSIVKFNLKTISKEQIYAIVLDRGVLNRDIDLLTASSKDAIKLVGRRKITYDVVRTGW